MANKRPPRHPVYKAWWAMRYRCYQEHHPLYKNYGARGIRVCARWRENCALFMSDMLPTWVPGLSLERIDNNGDYSPENCRWARVEAQARNRRNNRLLKTPFGTMHLADAEDFYGFGRGVIRGRLERGWPLDLALTAPTGTRLEDLV